MGAETSNGYCWNCKKRVAVYRRGTNHVVHLILSIFTCGLWLIIWLLSSIKIGGWKCGECGSKSIKDVA